MKFCGSDFINVYSALVPKAYSAASTSTGAIDTLGYSEAIVVLHAGAAAANAEAQVTVLESVSTTAASFAHVPGGTFTQVTPTAATNINQILSIDLTKRKRYLNIKNVGDGSNAVTFGVNVLFFRANSLPVTQTATEITRI